MRASVVFKMVLCVDYFHWRGVDVLIAIYLRSRLQLRMCM